MTLNIYVCNQFKACFKTYEKKGISYINYDIQAKYERDMKEIIIKEKRKNIVLP